MRRLIRLSMIRLLGLLWVGFAIGSLASASAQACTLRLGWEVFPPFQVAEGDDAGGLDLDLFRAAAASVDCEVVTREMPWRRLLRALETGEMDAAMGASITPEREAFARFSDTYRNDEFVLFVRRGEVDKVGPGGIADVVGARFRLGIVGGYSYGDTFDRLMQDPSFARQVQAAPTTLLNLRKLLAGRIDGFIESRPVGADVARKEGVLDQVAVHPVPVSSDPTHLMFSKKSVPAQVVERFNDALATMKVNGRYDEIMNKYLQ